MWRSGLIVAGSIAIAAPQQIEGQPPARTSVDCESPGPKPAVEGKLSRLEVWGSMNADAPGPLDPIPEALP